MFAIRGIVHRDMLGEVGILLNHGRDSVFHTDSLPFGSTRLQTNDFVRHLAKCREIEDEIAAKLLTVYFQVFQDKAADLDCLQGVDAETEGIGIFVQYGTFSEGNPLSHLLMQEFEKIFSGQAQSARLLVDISIIDLL